MTAMTMFATIGICVLSGSVVQIMAQDSFHEAIYAIPALTFGAALMQLTRFLNFSFLISNQTKTIAYITWANAIVITIFLILLTPRFGFVGASYATLFAGLFTLLLTNFLAERAQPLGKDFRSVNLYLWTAVLVISFDKVFLSGPVTLTNLSVKIGIITISGCLYAITMHRRTSTRELAQSAIREIRRRTGL